MRAMSVFDILHFGLINGIIHIAIKIITRGIRIEK